MLKVNEVPLFHYSAIESRITSLSKEIYFTMVLRFRKEIFS